MGDVAFVDDSQSPKLLRVHVEGTAALASVAIVKNNLVVLDASSGDESLVSEYVDSEKTQDGDFHYLRVRQEDGEMAWASPIWVNLRE